MPSAAKWDHLPREDGSIVGPQLRSARQTEALDIRGHQAVIEIDKFGTPFGILLCGKLTHRVDATTDTLPRFEHQDIKVRFVQRIGS